MDSGELYSELQFVIKKLLLVVNFQNGYQNYCYANSLTTTMFRVQKT